MDPVFTLQWPEYVVCEHLRRLCPKSEGFSVYIPVSRQEKGVDIALLKRGIGIRETITIQVKASRTYSSTPAKRKNITRYRYYTWFKRFTPSPDADYFALLGFFPRNTAQTTNITPTWYNDCTLLLSYSEMSELIEECRTVRGTSDSMFGFGFDDLSSVIYTRGDQFRSARNFSEHLLERKIIKIKSDWARRADGVR